MVIVFMKEKNNYFTSFNASENKFDYLKYGLTKDFGPNIEGNQEYYN